MTPISIVRLGHLIVEISSQIKLVTHLISTSIACMGNEGILLRIPTTITTCFLDVSKSGSKSIHAIVELDANFCRGDLGTTAFHLVCSHLQREEIDFRIKL